MTNRIVLVALALMSVARVALAQNTPPVSRTQNNPAVFRTEPYVATIVVEKPELSLIDIRRDDIYVLIDKRYRLPANVLPFAPAVRSSITFSPHDFMRDGKSHRVDVIRKGAPISSHQLTFPKPTRR